MKRKQKNEERKKNNNQISGRQKTKTEKTTTKKHSCKAMENSGWLAGLRANGERVRLAVESIRLTGQSNKQFEKQQQKNRTGRDGYRQAKRPNQQATPLTTTSASTTKTIAAMNKRTTTT